MRISDWSSDVCSSDLAVADIRRHVDNADAGANVADGGGRWFVAVAAVGTAIARDRRRADRARRAARRQHQPTQQQRDWFQVHGVVSPKAAHRRSEEQTSELQSLMRISYAVFCLKKKKQAQKHTKIQKTNNTNTYNMKN